MAALGAAAVAHIVAPARLPIDRRVGAIVGWATVGGALTVVAWAVASASAEGVAVDRPSALVRTGAYAVSRNPMYVAWSGGLVGMTLVTRSAWLAICAALATVAVDREVIAEEVRLRRVFGARYERYRAAVPRYLSWPSLGAFRGLRGRPASH